MAASVAVVRTSLMAAASAWAIFWARLLGAALDGFGQLLAGFNAIGFGFDLGLGHDVGGVLFGFGALLLVLGQKRLGFLAELPGFRQFLADLVGPLVQHLGQHGRHLEIDAKATKSMKATATQVSGSRNMACSYLPRPWQRRRWPRLW